MTEVLIFYADKHMVMGNSKNSRVFNCDSAQNRNNLMQNTRVLPCVSGLARGFVKSISVCVLQYILAQHRMAVFAASVAVFFDVESI